jgi:hypothetical protein
MYIDNEKEGGPREERLQRNSLEYVRYERYSAKRWTECAGGRATETIENDAKGAPYEINLV